MGMELTEADRAMLKVAAERLDDYAGELSPNGDTGTIQLAMSVRELAERC